MSLMAENSIKGSNYEFELLDNKICTGCNRVTKYSKIKNFAAYFYDLCN